MKPNVWSDDIEYREYQIQTVADSVAHGSYAGQWTGAYRIYKQTHVVTSASVTGFHQSPAHAATNAERVARLVIDELSGTN